MCTGFFNATTNFNCSCQAGYYLSLNDSGCLPANNCSTYNGGCSQNCLYDIHGLLYCTCNAGYTLSADSKTCVAVNNCVSNNGGCDQTCVYGGPGVSHCACNTGYTSNSTLCLPVNNCVTNNGGCGMYCAFTGPGTSSCSCSTGYVLEADGSTCVYVGKNIFSFSSFFSLQCTFSHGVWSRLHFIFLLRTTVAFMHWYPVHNYNLVSAVLFQINY